MVFFLAFVTLLAGVHSLPTSDDQAVNLMETESWKTMVGAPCNAGCPKPLKCKSGECCQVVNVRMPKIKRRPVNPVSNITEVGGKCGGPPDKETGNVLLCKETDENCLIADTHQKDAFGICMKSVLEGDCNGAIEDGDSTPAAPLCPPHYVCLMKDFPNEHGVKYPWGKCYLEHYDSKNPATFKRPLPTGLSETPSEGACHNMPDTPCPEVWKKCQVDVITSEDDCNEGYQCVFRDDQWGAKYGQCQPRRGFKCTNPAKDCAGLGTPKDGTCKGAWKCAVGKCVYLCA